MRNRWLVFAVAVSLLAAASIASASVQARSNGCIFDDGNAYCRMASGELAKAPFSRRVLVPEVVSWLPGDQSVTDRFQLIALIAAAGATIGTSLLAWRLLRDRAPRRVTWAASLAAGGLVALSPHMFRLALTEPVLVDQTSTALGLTWCLLVTARRAPLRWLSPLVVLLMIATREAWVLPMLLAAGVLLWSGRRPLAVATLAATVAAAAFSLSRASAPGRYSPLLEVLHNGRLALTRPDHSAWAVLFGVSLVSALALLLLVEWRRLRGTAGIVFAVALGHLVQSTVAGADAGRLAAAALPFAIVLALTAVVGSAPDRGFVALVALTAASVWLWRPFDVATGGVSGYASMYYPPDNAALVVLASLGLITLALVSVLRGGLAVGCSPPR